MPDPVLVVGAGLAGATAARALADAGRPVRVLDKGRGPGGRLSTRRRDGLAWSHGAPFLHGDDPAFATAVDAWVAAGAAARGLPRVARAHAGALVPVPAVPVVRGVPGTSAVVAALLDGLDVAFGAEVRDLVRDGGEVVARGADGVELGRAPRVVLGAPAPQAAALLAGLADDPEVAAARDALRAVVVDPVWAVLVRWPDAPDVDVLLDAGPVARAVRHGDGAWTLHATPAWSRAHLEDPADSVAAALVAALDGLGAPPLDAVAHRWRYARVAVPVGRPFLRAGPVVVVGDALLGPDAGHAWASGRAGATALLA